MRPSLVSGFLAAGVIAGPVAVRDIEVLPALQERGIPSIALGSWDLTTTHEQDVLFNVGVGATAANVGDAVHLEVICVDCRTWGSASVSTSGVAKNNDIIGDMIEFFEDPVSLIVSAFDLDLKIDFEGVGGHFEFDIFAADTVTYSIPIFESDTLAGIAISEEVSVGLVAAIDLVFSLTEEIDLEAGFEFSFPEGAYIIVDPLDGSIVEQSFIGGAVDNLPITVTSGSATFKAALRVRIQTGTTVVLFGTGFDFQLGVFADLIEYVATIGTSDSCELYITESIDVNIGAFARAVVEIDYHSFGVSPTVVTTLLDIPLPSLCLTRSVGTANLPYPTAATTTVASETSPDGPYPTDPSVSVPIASVPAYPTYSYSEGASPTSSIPFYTLSIPADPYPTDSIPASESLGYPSASLSYSESYLASSYSASYPGHAVSSYLNSYPVHPTTFQASGASSYTTSVPTTTYSASLSYFTASSSGLVSSSSAPSYFNVTVTSATSLTTSTVYTTDLITITKCAVTVLHCPASLTSEIVVTSTKVLYTTVCPVGQNQPTAAPSSLSASKSAGVSTSLALISPIPLTPYATPVVSTVYSTTFVTPTYTVPTATSFSVPYPDWNATSTSVEVGLSSASVVIGGFSTTTSAAIYTTCVPVYPVPVGNNSTALASGIALPSGTVGTVKVYPTTTALPFTGAANKSFGLGSGAFGLVAVAFFTLF